MDKSEPSPPLKIYRAEQSSEEVAPAETDKETVPAQRWAGEQEFDQLIGLKLQSTPVPGDLKSRLLEIPKVTSFPRTWVRRLLPIAALLIALAVFFGSWRGLFQPSVSLADYRAEMVSFIRIDPVLEMEAPDLSRITGFLESAGAPSRLRLPQKLPQVLPPLGCRILHFRGQHVTLICFGREEGDLVHLFVVNRAVLPRLRESDKAIQYRAEGEWMTATWVEGEQAYLLTVEGDRAKLEKYLTSS